MTVPRNVPFNTDTLTAYFQREWFPKTVHEVYKDFGVNYMVALGAVEGLAAAGVIVRTWHPVRNRYVYHLPDNSAMKQVLATEEGDAAKASES